MPTSKQPTTEAGVLTCVGCGYSLHGLAAEAACPECGESVARSAYIAYGVTKRELVVIACRLLALWFIVTGLMAAMGLSGWLIRMLVQGLDPDMWPWLASHLVTLGVTLLMGVLLWWWAGWIAGVIVWRDGLAATGGWKQRDVLRIALVVLGVFFVVTAVKGVASGGLSLGTGQAHYVGPVTGLPLLVGSIVQLGAGALCIAIGARGGRVIGRVWHWGRTAGT